VASALGYLGWVISFGDEENKNNNKNKMGISVMCRRFIKKRQKSEQYNLEQYIPKRFIKHHPCIVIGERTTSANDREPKYLPNAIPTKMTSEAGNAAMDSKYARVLLSSPKIRLQPRPSQLSRNRIIPLQPPSTLTNTSKNRLDLFPLPRTNVAFESSLKDFSKSSGILDLSASSTVNSNQATHREPSNTVPEKPFLFSTTLIISDLFATKKRNNFASTKNERSIPKYKRQPPRGITSSLAPNVSHMANWSARSVERAESGNKSQSGREGEERFRREKRALSKYFPSIQQNLKK
jgi:hypothetical protein